MEIEIKKEKDSCIQKDLKFELGNYTIFAGENNSGKTSLVRAIYRHKDIKDYKKIHIPAEHIQPQNEETKNSAAKTEFYKLLKSILGPLFDKKILEELIKKFDKSPEKKKFVQGVNDILKEFGVNEKKFDIKISDDELEEDFIIKITKAFVKDLYKTDIEEVDFNNIGMGTQRLIVAALIRYYEEQKIEEDEKLFVIFEEPEVYLHPKWKKELYKSLYKLSSRENTKVLITTHDPYFIELGKRQKIYRIFRNPDEKDTTDREEKDNNKILNYDSDSEINYQIFDIPSKTYFLELYEYLVSFFQTTNEDGKDVSISTTNKWIIEQNKSGKVEVQFEDNDTKSNPLVSKLRFQLAHPRKETEEGENIDGEYIKERIKELKNLIIEARKIKS